MKYILTFLFLIGGINWSFGQQPNELTDKSLKGNWSIYWGWNEGWFSTSDFNFKGSHYDFTLTNVIATDRQTPFALDVYLAPTKITIPQYNFRIGYFLNDHWVLSIGTDHMKYVIVENQSVKIKGTIRDSNTDYDGTYDNENIVLANDFLKLEHTDGLNYLNMGLRRYDRLFTLGKVQLNLTEGLSVGAVIPRTNTILLNKERYDAYHLSGYGINTMLGINLTFFDHFFIQSEFKAGFIDMPKVRTTQFREDRASHSFFFTQWNIVFGGRFRLDKFLLKKK